LSLGRCDSAHWNMWGTARRDSAGITDEDGIPWTSGEAIFRHLPRSARKSQVNTR